MSNIIEVEIENNSYVKLLNLDNEQNNSIMLTTLENNQSAVLIKIFLNTSKERILIKEFNIRNLTPKAPGIPRFELISIFNHKKLHLELKVDGQKGEKAVINLRSFIRNKLLLLFIIIALLGTFILFAGGKWLVSEVISGNSHSPESINKSENTKKEKSTDNNEPLIVNKIEESSEIIKEVKTTLHTAYFFPNNTTIQEGAGIILKDLAEKLKTLPEAEVEISGYCAMTGTKEGRDRLSRERAYNVLNYLKREGWSPEKTPVIKWYGGERPVTSDKNEIYRNRRVEIKIFL